MAYPGVFECRFSLILLGFSRVCTYPAVADEKYFYHIFLTPNLSRFILVFFYFLGICTLFQSIDHFPISRLFSAYLGMFLPPNGLKIGLKWSMISSLDHWCFLVYLWNKNFKNPQTTSASSCSSPFSANVMKHLPTTNG